MLIMVVDDEGDTLKGLITTKDIVRKVIHLGRNPSTTRVDEIMVRYL